MEGSSNHLRDPKTPQIDLVVQILMTQTTIDERAILAREFRIAQRIQNMDNQTLFCEN
jgi:hypothetical protein